MSNASTTPVAPAAVTEADLTRLSLPLTGITAETIANDETQLVEGLTSIAVTEHSADAEAKVQALVMEHYRRSFTVQLEARAWKLENGKTVYPIPVPATLAGDVADLGGTSTAYKKAMKGVWDAVEASVSTHLRKVDGFSPRAAKAEAKGYVAKARDRVGYAFRVLLDESGLTADELLTYGFSRSNKLPKDQVIPEGYPALGGSAPAASPAVKALARANTDLSAKEKGGALTDSADLNTVLANLLIIVKTVSGNRPMPTAKAQADRTRNLVKEIGLALQNVVAPKASK